MNASGRRLQRARHLDPLFALFSSARAPARIPSRPVFPSWQAYSYICSLERLRGIITVHGLVHVAGSLNVTSYLTVVGLTRVKRSVTRTLSEEFIRLLFGEQFVVSTTSVSPSQR